MINTHFSRITKKLNDNINRRFGFIDHAADSYNRFMNGARGTNGFIEQFHRGLSQFESSPYTPADVERIYKAQWPKINYKNRVPDFRDYDRIQNRSTINKQLFEGLDEMSTVENTVARVENTGESLTSRRFGQSINDFKQKEKMQNVYNRYKHEITASPESVKTPGVATPVDPFSTEYITAQKDLEQQYINYAKKTNRSQAKLPPSKTLTSPVIDEVISDMKQPGQVGFDQIKDRFQIGQGHLNTYTGKIQVIQNGKLVPLKIPRGDLKIGMVHGGLDEFGKWVSNPFKSLPSQPIDNFTNGLDVLVSCNPGARKLGFWRHFFKRPTIYFQTPLSPQLNSARLGIDQFAVMSRDLGQSVLQINLKSTHTMQKTLSIWDPGNLLSTMAKSGKVQGIAVAAATLFAGMIAIKTIKDIYKVGDDMSRRARKLGSRMGAVDFSKGLEFGYLT